MPMYEFQDVNDNRTVAQDPENLPDKDDSCESGLWQVHLRSQKVTERAAKL